MLGDGPTPWAAPHLDLTLTEPALVLLLTLWRDWFLGPKEPNFTVRGLEQL